MKAEFVVDGLEKPARLDKVLQQQFPAWGRKAVKTTVNARKVKFNNKTVWLGSWEIQNGDRILVTDPPKEKRQAPKVFNDDWVVAEKDDMIVVNKPADLRSQTTRARGEDNLLSLAMKRFGDVHLFHRLDRDASGICLLTRPGPVNHYLDQAFKAGLVEKEYLAVVRKGDRLDDSGVIISRMDTHPQRRDKMTVVDRGGKHAETRYEIIETKKDMTLVCLRPITGRTHQLRVHMYHIGTPILGDRLYGGGEKEAPRLMLHATRIVIPEGEGYRERSYEAEVPADFLKI